MAEDLKGKLEQRIQKKREEAAKLAAAAASGQPSAVPAEVAPVVPQVETPAPLPPVVALAPAVAVAAVQKFPSETSAATPAQSPKASKAAREDLEPLLDAAREAIANNKNAMTIARQLGQLIGLGLRNKDLTEQLGQSKSWVSKKLALLTAPVKVQRLIEAGELPESDYHNTKNVTAQIKGRAGTLEYRRMPTVTISLETAKSLAAILRIIAEENGDTSLTLPASPSRKDISSLLDLRTAGVYELIK